MWKLGRYFGELEVAGQRAGALMLLITVLWISYPFALQTALHPADAIGLLHWAEGEEVPQLFTRRQIFAGEIEAVTSFVALNLLLLVAVTVFYRKVRFSVALWPLPALLTGCIGNAIWWYATGYFDATGGLIGLPPLAALVVCQMFYEKWGQDFVFGPGNRPEFDPWG